LRSSDGGASYSGGLDDVGLDERTKIERKIEQIKERLSRISLAREADVDDFLSMTSSMEGGSENPQLARVRQHFEKKNKKSAQEADHLQVMLHVFSFFLDKSDSSWRGGGGGSLRSSDGGASYSGGLDDVGLDERTKIERKIEQIKERLSRISLALYAQKKLEQLQSKLLELDLGIIVEPSPKSAVLNNIRKTGPLIREVMSAPRGIAHMIKNTFGSVDNIPGNVSSDAANIGHSTFYSDASNNDSTKRLKNVAHFRMSDLEDRDATSSPTKRGHKRTETLPAMAFDLDALLASPFPQSEALQRREPQVKFSSVDNVAELRNDLQMLKAQNQALVEQLNKLQVSFASEVSFQQLYLYYGRLTLISFLVESTQNKSEFKYFNNALHEERIKAQVR
uniref:PCM1_C domain-containing protein n=1 Tax=Gongylonema pulchrum TaxID=637853 RepID=A0A183E8L0_9BILA